MTETSSPRPPQVTMAGWVSMVGSAFVVSALYGTVANLRSIETREQVTAALDRWPLDSMDMTLDRWLSVMHAVSLAGAACAVTAGILGFYVLRGSTSARIGLTLVAPPLFVTGMVAPAAGFMATLVAVSALMLWTRPARDWFAGRPWLPSMMSPSKETASKETPSKETPSKEAAAARPHRDLEDPSSPQPPPPPPAPWQPPPGTQLPPHPGFGAPVSQPVVPAGRPVPLVIACVLTWVVAGMVAIVFLLALVAMLVVPDLWTDEMRRQVTDQADVSWEQARRAMLGASVIFGSWSLAAVVLAVLVFLGREWARIVLIVSAAAATMFMALSVLGTGLAGLVLLLPLVACGATVSLLARREVAGWTRAQSVR